MVQICHHKRSERFSKLMTWDDRGKEGQNLRGNWVWLRCIFYKSLWDSKAGENWPCPLNWWNWRLSHMWLTWSTTERTAVNISGLFEKTKENMSLLPSHTPFLLALTPSSRVTTKNSQDPAEIWFFFTHRLCNHQNSHRVGLYSC